MNIHVFAFGVGFEIKLIGTLQKFNIPLTVPFSLLPILNHTALHGDDVK